MTKSEEELRQHLLVQLIVVFIIPIIGFIFYFEYKNKGEQKKANWIATTSLIFFLNWIAIAFGGFGVALFIFTILYLVWQYQELEKIVQETSLSPDTTEEVPEPIQVVHSRVCQKCGGELTAGQQFCSQCGTPVTLDTVEEVPEPTQVAHPKFCSQCGAELIADQSFCGQCGASTT